jgi:hypothetical protein
MILISLFGGNSDRTIAERWYHSPSTISASLHEVIDLFLKKELIDFLMIPPDPVATC